MMSFNNACWKPNAEIAEIIKEIDNACAGWDSNQIRFSKEDEMDKKNKILLWLLIHEKAYFAYWLNKKLFKMKFH